MFLFLLVIQHFPTESVRNNYEHASVRNIILLLLFIETKNQWARDDPAFAVVEAGFVAVCVVLCCCFLLNLTTKKLLWVKYRVFVGGNVSVCNRISKPKLLGIPLECTLWTHSGLASSWPSRCIHYKVRMPLPLPRKFDIMKIKSRLVYSSIIVILQTSICGNIMRIVSNKKSSGYLHSTFIWMPFCAAFLWLMFCR
jgi:hypothetical protein